MIYRHYEKVRVVIFIITLLGSYWVFMTKQQTLRMLNDISEYTPNKRSTTIKDLF